MNEESWQKWAQTLQQKHITGLALTLLEGSGPMKMIFSQLMFSTIPFFGSTAREEWMAVAEMLESETASREFAAILREENKP